MQNPHDQDEPEELEGIKQEKISCQSLVYRIVKRRDWIDEDTGGLRPAAFIPRPDGQDAQGLSVSVAPSRVSKEVSEGVQAYIERSGLSRPKGVVTLLVGWLRDIEGLDVVPDPVIDDPVLPDNPDHALITGIPWTPDHNADAERVAGLLARLARFVWRRGQ
jgi:hypothetical protein